MAPPAEINKKTKSSKSGTKEKKKSKKDLKIDLDLKVEKSKPVNSSKKNKKRKLEPTSDMNREDNTMSNKGTKQKKDKNKKKQKVNNTNNDEEEEEDININNDKTITDKRFSSSMHDPMFRRMKKKDSKIEIDSRFSKMFENKDFVGSSAPVDKRGKPRKDEKGEALMAHYHLNQDKIKIQENDDEDDEEKEEEIEREDDVAESDVSSSTDDESSSLDDDDDENHDESLGNYDISNYLMANHEDTPTTEKETHRLAIVNMDWDHIKAVDLYVVMTSCLPQGGKIESVSVYPSEFGIKCMEIESTKGPGALLDLKPIDNDNNDDENNDRDTDSDNDDNNDDFDEFDDDDIDELEDEDENDDDDTSDEDEEEDEEVNEKLRGYELNKLRYYYAVVVCDSSSTANHIYNTLDTTELLDTSNVFDLRFIPDSMQFVHEPRDVATEVPSNYKEPNFETRALQHSTVKLTWEDEKSDRKRVLRRNFNLDQLDELNVYLASSDLSEDEEEDAKESKKKTDREKFLSLLKSGNGDSSSDKSEGEGEEEEREEKGDMEITFNTDLEALSKKILEKKEKKNDETVWESVLRKKKEKKKAQKISNDDDDDDDHYEDNNDDDEDEDDDFFMDDNKSKKNAKRTEKPKKEKEKEKESLEREREASCAELELLLADDEENKGEKKGYNMKKMNKTKGKKGKKEKDENQEEKLPEVNVGDDPRFSKMFNSHLFALDPTDPQYKRSATYLRNKPKKGEKKSGKKEATQDYATEDLEVEEKDEKSKKKYEISAAIRSIKKNIAPHQNRLEKDW